MLPVTRESWAQFQMLFSCFLMCAYGKVNSYRVKESISCLFTTADWNYHLYQISICVFAIDGGHFRALLKQYIDVIRRGWSSYMLLLLDCALTTHNQHMWHKCSRPLFLHLFCCSLEGVSIQQIHQWLGITHSIFQSALLICHLDTHVGILV